MDNNMSSPPAPLVFPQRLNPEVAARKSRLILSLMVSLARCGGGGGSEASSSAPSQKGNLGMEQEQEDSKATVSENGRRTAANSAEVAELVRALLVDKISPEEFQPRVSVHLPATQKMANLVPILNLGLPNLRESISRGEVSIKGISVGFGQEESVDPTSQGGGDAGTVVDQAPFDEDELTSMIEEVMTIN